MLGWRGLVALLFFWFLVGLGGGGCVDRGWGWGGFCNKSKQRNELKMLYAKGFCGGGEKGQGKGLMFTRVVCKTLAKRGKSWTPESRIEMLEDRSWLLERRDETQEESAWAIFRALDCAFVGRIGGGFWVGWLVVVGGGGGL